MSRIVSEWLESSEGDFRMMVAGEALDPPEPTGICFHAQQCVEKLMKAVLIAAGVDVPKTHFLPDLARLIRSRHPHWEWDEGEMRELTDGAVELRYPRHSPDVDDATRLADICRRIRPALLKLLDSPAEADGAAGA